MRVVTGYIKRDAVGRYERQTWTYTIAVLKLEGFQTQTPTWRIFQELFIETARSELYCDIQIDIWSKKELKYPFVKGVYPNRPISKAQIKQLFPECAKMPLAYCLDYIRDKL